MGAALDPEQRHDAVADELVDASSCRFDGESYRCEIAVENEHHVIGKPAFGERGEAANVDEQDRNLLLPALRKVDSVPPVRGTRERWQKCTSTAPRGRNWQARRTLGVAPMR
jgi:hypothetical protein